LYRRFGVHSLASLFEAHDAQLRAAG
jgi:hypothetical protein